MPHLLPHTESDASGGPSSSEGEEDFSLSRYGRSVESTEFYSPLPKGYQRGRHKYVAVFGTVMSGLGKGIFSSSLAKLMKDKGFTVTPIKLEGYLNIDSGTLNPYRHGEVFVLDDGTECDMDLGTYERMLDQNLLRQNFVTSGQIYTTILERERKGGYLGRDVQMIPHVTGEVKYRLRKLAMTGGPDGGPADVVFVEVGGTVGDYENGFYIEALRELAFEEGPNSTCSVALTYILEPSTLGEQKSKAAQLGIKRLMEAGVQPQIIACRAGREVTETVKQKISLFSNVPLQRVFSMHDRESIYTIPEAMRDEGLDREILTILDFHGKVNARVEDKARANWHAFTSRLLAPRKYNIRLGILGKYTALRDAYASIDKALEHASAHLSAAIDTEWVDTTTLNEANVVENLEGKFDAVIVPGGFGDRGVRGKIACVQYVRGNDVPFLGICLGFQMAVIEFARNVLGMGGANSTEFDANCADAVISELPEQKKIEGLGGTMRLGAQDLLIERDTLAHFLFADDRVRGRFRHRWEVDPAYIDRLSDAGLVFSGRHPEHQIMQVLELPLAAHPYFIAGQFHPELTSRPLSPQPMFMGLVAAGIAHAYPDVLPESISDRWLPEKTTTGSAAPENPSEADPCPPDVRNVATPPTASIAN